MTKASGREASWLKQRRLGADHLTMITTVQRAPGAARPFRMLSGVALVVFLVGLGVLLAGHLSTSAGMVVVLPAFAALIALGVVGNRRIVCPSCAGTLVQHRPINQVAPGAPIYARCEPCAIDWDFDVRRIAD